MAKTVTKFMMLAFLLLLLGLPSYAQNTKGDRPPSRENRFRKTEGTQKVRRSKQKKQSVARRKDFRPSKKVNATDRAARPVSRLRNTDPAKSEKRSRAGDLRRRGTTAPSERSKNVYRQRRLYVHNNARDPDHDQRPPIPNKKVKARVKNLSARQRPDNVFPQEGRFVNNPSKIPRAHPRGESNRPQLTRLKKLQGPDPRPKPKKRVVTRSVSRSYTARRSINIVASYPRPKRKTEKAYTRDIAGRRLRTRNYESPRPALVRPQAGGRYAFRSKPRPASSEGPRFSSSSRQGPKRRAKVTPRSASSSRKIFETTGIFGKGGATQPRPVERVDSDRPSRKRLRQQQTRRDRQRRVLTVTPRSASGGFQARKSPNMWARFPRPKKKGERPYLKDIAGNPLRTRNYETPPRAVIPPDYKPYFGRKRVGDRPYPGKPDRYRSATRKQPRAWTGDIAGRKIRGKKTPGGDRPSGILSRGYKTSRPGRGIREPLPAKQPGIGAASIRKYRGERKSLRGMSNQGEEYTGDIRRARRKYKPQGEEYRGNISGIRRGYRDQGEEFSGSTKARKRQYRNQGEEYRGDRRGLRRGFRDQGEQYTGNLKGRRKYRDQGEESPGKLRRFYDQPGFHDQGEEFSGTLKTRRSPKGGGSVSGKRWNNQGRAIPVRSPRQTGYGEFSGAIKARRPLKGGGSVSGKLWNNQGRAIAVRPPEEDRAGTYQGTLKARRQPEGRPRTISGKQWNNRGSAIAVRKPSKRAAEVSSYPGRLRRFYDQPGFHDQGEEYTGAIKARRPLKGGGSVSGKIWNNDGRAIVGKIPGGDYQRVGRYQGTLKTRRPAKGGGSVSGKLWNNNEAPLTVRTPSPEAGKAGAYSGDIKISRFRREYVKNPNASGEALRKIKPTKSVFDEGDLQVRVARRAYVKNKNASGDALKKVKPSRSVFQEGDLQVRSRQFQYVHNSSSAKSAMKTREPGRAFGRAVDYQGNIRMQKFSLARRNRELHPDSKFVKVNKNNVPQEKDALTNFKLWWARLFRKNDGQPDHLKDKNRRPRYDKGEEGLWYE